jgi:PPIC-type PPIASE domain
MLRGVCDQPRIAEEQAGCKRVITRGELDSLVDLLTPGTSEAVRRQFAIIYARLLAATATAEGQRLEEDPRVADELQAKLKFVRLQVLANALYRKFEVQAGEVSPAEIEKYYAEHSTLFAQGEVERITIPKTALAANGAPLEAMRVKAKAEDIQARAKAGEDFRQLQESVYRDLGITAAAAPSKPEKIRPSELPPLEAKVFDLQPGEVSPLEESANAFIILKLVSKQTVPLASVQTEIKSILQQQRLQQELQTASESVKGQFNLGYLGVPTPPELFPLPGAAPSSSSGLGRAPDTRQRTMMGRRRVATPTGGPGTAATPASTPAQ